MPTAQEVLNTASALGWIEPAPSTKARDAFGHRCAGCGEFNATKVCLYCLAAKTGATVTGDARGTVVIMPGAIRVGVRR